MALFFDLDVSPEDIEEAHNLPRPGQEEDVLTVEEEAPDVIEEDTPAPSPIDSEETALTAEEDTQAEPVDREEAPAAYITAGWTEPFNLPSGRKEPAPTNTTGWKTPTQSPEPWHLPDGANLGVRMPVGVLGLDIDHPKVFEQFRELNGLSELPPSPYNTRHGADSFNRHIYYTVPDGYRAHGDMRVDAESKAGETLQNGHRYSVAWPSVVEGKHYRWYDANGVESGVPAVTELREMPADWLAALEKSTPRVVKGAVPSDAAAFKWLKNNVAGCTEPEISPSLASILDQPWPKKGGRHTEMVNRMYGLLRDAVRTGVPGLNAALIQLEEDYVTAAGMDYPEDELEEKVQSALNGGVALVKAEIEQGSLTHAKKPVVIPSAGLPAPSEKHADVDCSEFEKYGAADAEGFKADKIKFKNRRAAERAVEAEEREAESAQYAKPEGISIADLLGTEFPEEQWVVEQLIEDGQQILLYSAAKQGKSYLVQELMGALSTGKPFLGQYPTTAPTGNIGLVDVELHPRKLAERLEKREWEDNLRIYTLRGTAVGQDKLMKLNLASEASRREWVDRWKADGIEYLIVDPLSALIREAGLSEWNEGGLALRYLQQMTAEAGIRAHVVVTHASSKKDGMENGPRGDSAMLDVPDNVWKLVNDKERNTLTLTTVGRTDAVGVEADWLPGGRFRFNRAFDPFSVVEKKAKGGGPSPAAIGSTVSRTVFELAEAKAEGPTSFHSTAWCQDKDQAELWPRNKAAMVDLIQREGGYKNGDEFLLSKATAEKYLDSLLKDGSYFRLVGSTRSGRYVPTKPPFEVGFEPSDSFEVGG